MRRMVLCSLLLVACGPPEKDPAVVAFEGLAIAIARGDTETLARGLTGESRRALAAKLGLNGPAAEAELIKRLQVRPGWTFEREVGRTPRLAEDGSTAERRVVQGSLGGQPLKAVLIKEGDDWKLDLAQTQPEG